MGQGLGIENIRGHLALVLPREVAEHVLVALLAGSQNYELHLILAHLIHHVGNQIEALLVCQTGYDSDHHLLRIHVKAQLLLESRLILYLLLAEIHRVVIVGQEFIRLRIVLVVIDAVHDSA